MTEIASPVIATMRVLGRNLDITQAMGGTSRIYGGEIPGARVSSMPERCIVIAASPSPGISPGTSDLLPVSVNRIDVRCYGRNRMDAHLLSLTVAYVLKNFQNSIVDRHVIHHFKHAAGPVTYLEPPADWPVEVVTFDVQIADALV